MRTFKVWPGIGDFSFLYSKLANMGEEVGIRVAADSLPRLSEFIGLLPNCKFLGYDNSFNPQVVSRNNFVGDLTIPSSEPQFITANPHLEAGGLLSDFHPELATTYHYDINYRPDSVQNVVNAMKDAGRIKIGIYTSYRFNMQHFGFWQENEWARLICALNKFYDAPTFYLIGASWDRDLSDAVVDLSRHNGIDIRNMIGLHISDSICLIKNLDYFFSFMSGMSVLGDVVNTRTVMFMVSYLDKMLNTFADPDNIRNNRFFPTPYLTPEQTMEWVAAHWPHEKGALK